MPNKIIKRTEYEPDDEYPFGSVDIIAIIQGKKCNYRLEYLSEDKDDGNSNMLYMIQIHTDKPTYNLDELISENKLIETKTSEKMFAEYMELYDANNMEELEILMGEKIETHTWKQIYTGTLLEGMLKEKILKLDRLVTTKYVRNGLSRYVFVDPKITEIYKMSQKNKQTTSLDELTAPYGI